MLDRSATRMQSMWDALLNAAAEGPQAVPLNGGLSDVYTIDSPRVITPKAFYHLPSGSTKKSLRHSGRNRRVLKRNDSGASPCWTGREEHTYLRQIFVRFEKLCGVLPKFVAAVYRLAPLEGRCPASSSSRDLIRLIICSVSDSPHNAGRKSLPGSEVIVVETLWGPDGLPVQCTPIASDHTADQAPDLGGWRYCSQLQQFKFHIPSEREPVVPRAPSLTLPTRQPQQNPAIAAPSLKLQPSKPLEPPARFEKVKDTLEDTEADAEASTRNRRSGKRGRSPAAQQVHVFSKNQPQLQGPAAKRQRSASVAATGLEVSGPVGTSSSILRETQAAASPSEGPEIHSDSHTVMIPPATGDAADLRLLMSRFCVSTCDVADDCTDVSLSWSYPLGCARDNNVELCVYDAELGWGEGQLNLPTVLAQHEALGITVERRYIPDNTDAGMMRFVFSSFADGQYVAVLVDKSGPTSHDVARAVSQIIAVRSGRVTAVVGQPRISAPDRRGGRRRG